jgi:predicted amidohydrolase
VTPTSMRVALASDADWREAVRRERSRGAELICLPQLSFSEYFPAVRDRAGLELAERPPSRNLREAVGLADGAWLAASTYESEGEGVFYVTSHLAGPEGGMSYRQRLVEAKRGRYEQMFFSPGYEPPVVSELPAGPATTLVGADVRDPEAWASAADAGARVVLGGASDDAGTWMLTERIVATMAAVYGLTGLVVNRAGEHAGVVHPGGVAAFGPDGSELAADADGLFEVSAEGAR